MFIYNDQFNFPFITSVINKMNRLSLGFSMVYTDVELFRWFVSSKWNPKNLNVIKVFKVWYNLSVWFICPHVFLWSLV